MENEKRQKMMGSIENKKKIEEKLDDYNNSEEYLIFCLRFFKYFFKAKNLSSLHFQRKNPGIKKLPQD